MVEEVNKQTTEKAVEESAGDEAGVAEENYEENDQDEAVEAEVGDGEGQDEGEGEGEGEGDGDGEGEGEGDGEGEGEGEEDDEAFPECDEAEEAAEDEEDKEDVKEGATKAFDLEETLKAKVKFKDDTEAFIFSRGPKYSEDKWPVNCHVCRLGNLVTKEQVKSHVKSKRHTANVRRKWPDFESFNTPFYQCADKNLGLDKPIKIYPGESISELTTELEDRIVKQEEFAVKKPSEKIIKELSDEPMHEYNKKLPLIGLCYMYKMKGQNGITYYCTLCNLKIRGHGFKHVTGPNHQYKYIERHFPKFYKKVVERLKKDRTFDFKRNVRNIFRKLYRKIENAKGFREVTLVDDDDFFKNKKRYLLKTRFDTHYDEDTILITEQEVDILIRKCINRMEFIKPDLKSLDKDGKGTESRSRPPKRSAPRSYDREMTTDDDATWERYHHIMQREIDYLNREYRRYDHNPKKHPLYLSENRPFFKGSGKDQRKLKILKREWIPYWRRRLRQFYEKDLAKRKLRVKRELRLRTDVRTPSPIDSPRRKIPSRRTPSPMRYDARYADHRNSRNNMMDSLPPAPSEPLGVISVLRLLTALEDKLGSLGPKAVQLMSKAVLAEKSNQNPNDLMMENEVYIFFVTAKEKLKGQLYANIVDPGMIAAVNRAVNDSTTLLDMFEDYMRRTGKRPGGSTSSVNQFDNSMSNTTAPANQYTSNQSNQYRVGGTQYTSDNNGSSSQFGSSGGGQYSGLSSNQYQTGSGSGNAYSTSGGSNQYSSGGSGQFTGTGTQYRGGTQGGIWQSGNNDDSFPGNSFSSNKQPSGYQSRNLSTQSGMSSRMY